MSATRAPSRGGGMGGPAEAPQHPAVLIVEDEVLTAWHLASVFRDRGFDVIGPAGSLEAAEALIRNRTPGVAVLDVNIRGRPVFTLARILFDRGVQLVFATAHAREDDLWPDDLAGFPRVQKPFLDERLVRIVTALLGETGTG